MTEGGILVLGMADPALFELFAGAGRREGLEVRSWEEAGGEGSFPSPCLVVLETRWNRPSAYEAALSLKGRSGTRVLLVGDPSFREEALELGAFTGARVLFPPIRVEEAASVLREENPGRERPSPDRLLREREAALDKDEFSKRVLQGLSGWEESGESLVQSLLDGETGLFHQGFMKLRMEEEVKRARRFHQVLTLVLLHFEAPPGWAGAPPAELLLSMSGRLLTETRDIDLLGRWGGDSLALLLPGTPPEGAAAMMRRVFPDAREILLRAGGWKAPVGIAHAPAEGIEKGRDLLAGALRAMEEARSSLGGKDLVGLSGPGAGS